MKVPKVLNRRYLPGGRIPPGAVYCGRGSPWGNPFRLSGNGMNRDEVCDRYEREILPNLDVTILRGKDLVCFCAPKRCHCDALLKKANS
jgi:hypothetical protein